MRFLALKLQTTGKRRKPPLHARRRCHLESAIREIPRAHWGLLQKWKLGHGHEPFILPTEAGLQPFPQKET